MAGEPITVYGTGTQSRCFGHVKDAVESVIRLLETPSTVRQVYNVGGDEEVTMYRLAEMVRDAAGSSSKSFWFPIPKPMRRASRTCSVEFPIRESSRRLSGSVPVHRCPRSLRMS